MYTTKDLEKYDNGSDINFLLDSLTGVISRQYILDFVKNLVEKNTPFAKCFMDLDNFTYINDNYGHKAGDKNKRVCVGEDWLVHLFGGDEFIILLLFLIFIIKILNQY